MDLVDLTKEIDKINRETIPLITAQLHGLIVELHDLLDRLNGATITINIPERKTND